MELLERHVQADSLRKHCLATEAIMVALARRFAEEELLWGIVGLLHDLDFDYTRNQPAAHGLKTVELLAPYHLPPEALLAILRHNAEALRLERATRLDYALTCAESITGLIVAAALVHPERRLRSVQAKSVLKRMKSKDFARNVNREHIALCERIDVPQQEFVRLSLEAMTAVSDSLGL
jgi:predicted hydrolase (HD superfamily)